MPPVGLPQTPGPLPVAVPQIPGAITQVPIITMPPNPALMITTARPMPVYPAGQPQPLILGSPDGRINPPNAVGSTFRFP